MNNNTLVQNYQGPLPGNYHSLVSREYKVSYALELSELARDRGLTPVAVSVSGSTLRGMDHEDSDVDALVLVEDKDFKATTWDNDVQVQSFGTYVEKLSTSVPYVEFLNSPFMVVDPRYRPYLMSQVVNPLVLHAHAQRFVGHLMARGTVGNTYRKCFATWYLINHGTPLVPREFMDEQNAPAEFWYWLEESNENYLEAQNRHN